ncbi:MAG: SAM-dependent methyltransferase, partial [Campylobacterales bacterium]|nr:SAM-dependent methyltransferase [Campylobacterales bacterium]
MPLTFVPTPLGNLEDITFRSLKTIESSEVVFCEDTRVSKKLIDLLAEKYS